MSVTIYHNPRCSKSRQTLALLQEKSIKPEIVEYLKTPPDKATLRKILSMLDLAPRELMRRNEAAYRERGLDADGIDDDTLLEAMIDEPILIERPIVVADGKAAIGRPPENILEIL